MHLQVFLVKDKNVQKPSVAINSEWGHRDRIPSHLTTCSNVGTEGRADQTTTLFHRQHTELRDQQEVEGCSGHLLSAAQQRHQLLDQITCYRTVNYRKRDIQGDTVARLEVSCKAHMRKRNTRNSVYIHLFNLCLTLHESKWDVFPVDFYLSFLSFPVMLIQWRAFDVQARDKTYDYVC